MIKKFLICSALFIAAGSTLAQSLKDQPITLKVGNWSVLRSVDGMTDQVTCTGIYKNNYGVQLSENAMYINIAGGLQSITIRFDENPAQPMRLPSDTEKKIGSITIKDSEFSQALESNRIRIRSLTLVRGLAQEDLDITGIQTALEHIRAGCPSSNSSTAQSTKRTAPASGTPHQENLCSEQLLINLRAAKVSEKQIKRACNGD